MNIKDLLVKDVMIMDLKATTKEAAIDEMIAKLAASGRISDAEIYKEGIMKREAQTSTGLGDGIAMPHAKNKAVNQATVLFAKSAQGVDYDSLDGQPAFLFFMIAAPEGANDTHLQALAGLSKLLINPDFVASLKEATSPDEVEELVAQAEIAYAEAEKAELEASKSSVPSEDKPFVVAVTACPTGIAHTYMAEDALKKKAAEMGVDIRVETNGSEGIKNKLTDDEIARAAGVIVAADKNVEMNRFAGKAVLERPVSDGIRKSEELIRKAVASDAPIYHASGEKSSETNEKSGGSIWSKIYKDLMNGVSHMLPFVVGGGILMAISFLVENTMGDKSQAFQFLNSIGGNAFSFLIPILAGFIAMSIGDRPGL
ncbi:MAG: fructose PTS transporter subunit IIA, partial [Carnobacterium sp.]